LFADHRTLRRAALCQMCISGGFFAFWSTLALMLERPPFHMGPAVAGLLGLVGAGGALAAPLAGRFSDHNDPSKLVLIGAGLAVASFAAMGLWQGSMAVLVAGALFMDVGVQMSLIANQTRIYALDPAARGRLTGALIGSMFASAAIASAIASYAFSVAGWTGVCIETTLFAVAGVLVEIVYRRGDRVIAAPPVEAGQRP
jgi:predicted MFS family arabinose efflux permease